MKMQIGKKIDRTQELIDIFEPDEGSINMYYGRIGGGKTYAATSDVLDLLKNGRVVYVNWHINWEGFDERNSFWHLFYQTICFWKKRFFVFPRENLRYFSPDDVSVEWLSTLTDCEIFIDEGQWIFDSYEGRQFSKEKRRLILHTRHLNRSLNIISQRTQAIQVSARGQVNRFFKCSKKMSYPFLIFKREEFQDMVGDDVDDTQDPISVKVYFAKHDVLDAYDSKYMRAGVPRSQEVYFEAYDVDFASRLWQLLRFVFGRVAFKRDRPSFGVLSSVSSADYMDALKLQIKHFSSEGSVIPLKKDTRDGEQNSGVLGDMVEDGTLLQRRQEEHSI